MKFRIIIGESWLDRPNLTTINKGNNAYRHVYEARSRCWIGGWSIVGWSPTEKSTSIRSLTEWHGIVSMSSGMAVREFEVSRSWDLFVHENCSPFLSTGFLSRGMLANMGRMSECPCYWSLVSKRRCTHDNCFFSLREMG